MATPDRSPAQEGLKQSKVASQSSKPILSTQESEYGSKQQSLLQPTNISSTFITLSSTPTMDSDSDDENSEISQSSGPVRKRTITTGTTPASGPYLATPVVGQRSLSTPNLHADNDDDFPNPDFPLITQSPMTSPSVSPRLTPRSTASAIPAMVPIANRSTNGDRQGSVNGSKSKAPLPDGTKTLKSSKNKTINRSSIASLFDTSASSMTLPTNFARKGSLPQDSTKAGNNTGLAGLFDNQPQDITNTPFSLTLAEFRLNDMYPKRQRRLLTVLHRMDHRLRQEDKEVLKPDRKSLNKDFNKKGTQHHGGFMAQKIPGFLRSKKLKKRTRPVIIHNIEMAIRDKRPELAVQYISLLPSNALKKKKKKSYSGLNHCMLLAMIYRMEQVAIELVDRGFPIDVNYPILGRAGEEHRTKPGKTGPFEYPSYFIVAVGLGMCNLVKSMIKNANLNQSWCGLTPLLLATTLNECTNATCPPPTLPPAKLATMLSKGNRVHLDIASQTLISQLPSTFNNSVSTQFQIPGYAPTSPSSIVTTLLEYGADPNQGITLQQYLWASKLKGMGVLRRRRKVVDGKDSDNNPIEYYIAARRYESGRQWLSHEEIKARKLAKAQEIQANGGNKRFSPEMQEFWKGKWILPVELAIASGNLDCARVILQRLGPNSLSNSSFGLLLQNDVMLTLSLIKSGSPVSQRDPHGCTPLHLAARRGHSEMVMVLVQLGGDVNARGERQWTPLHESISQNHGNISSMLIACGADLNAKNEAGETPEDVGRRRGLSAEVIADHLDATKAKTCSAGLANSIGNHLPNHIAPSTSGNRSGAPSRKASNEQLSSSTLRSMMSGSAEKNGGKDQARLSQHFPTSMADSNNGSHGNGRKSPLTISQDSLYQSSGYGSGSSTPLTPSSSSSSLTGSRSSSSEKKKKVRGFLKKIFN
ncbi:hypothetical protein BGZ76_002490 [Entomortierella beljakovae]|nr:hypothetical protein BGZ76_002490 [Entomortierella beljakovae]